jgi:protein-S-isoprenylcysteine O-methyltransferase Ste14
MPVSLGALAIALLIAMVLLRLAMLRRQGVMAMRFGAIDKTDFIIPPFAFFYVYLVFSRAFSWPTIVRHDFVVSPWFRWIGVAFCASAVIVMVASLVSFGTSFRVGIDAQQPGKLVTSGIFRLTRNPIYVAFAFALLGEFLIQPNWLMLAYLLAGVALFHRQVLREESYLGTHYGDEYREYSRRVRRYL